jgi:hypothetical protein
MEQFQKVQLPFWSLCIAVSTTYIQNRIIFCNTWGRTKIKVKKGRLGLKLCLLAVKPSQPYQFLATLIWCDGIFKSSLMLGVSPLFDP